jgi:hypothetical protein
MSWGRRPPVLHDALQMDDCLNEPLIIRFSGIESLIFFSSLSLIALKPGMRDGALGLKNLTGPADEDLRHCGSAGWAQGAAINSELDEVGRGTRRGHLLDLVLVDIERRWRALRAGLENAITDAGTDAKVAKFFKRGLDVVGLAILEPVEVRGHGKLWVIMSPTFDFYVHLSVHLRMRTRQPS